MVFIKNTYHVRDGLLVTSSSGEVFFRYSRLELSPIAGARPFPPRKIAERVRVTSS